MTKKFYRATSDFTHTFKITDAYGVEHECHMPVKAGEFIDIDEDPVFGEHDVDWEAVNNHCYQEFPSWFYFAFVKGQDPRYDYLDVVKNREDAIAIGRELYEAETPYRRANMFECGVICALDDANVLSDSGWGVADCEHFVLNW